MTFADRALVIDTFEFGDYAPFDPNDPAQAERLRQTIEYASVHLPQWSAEEATDYFHLERQHDARPTLKRVAEAGVRFLVVSFTSDWLYPTYQSRVMVRAMKRHGIDVSFCEIEADWGHDAFLLPSEHLSTLMKGFLDRVYSETRR